MKYKVAYIDEVDRDIRSFKRSVLLRANVKFDVITVKPKSSIEDTVSEVFEQYADAVVADFRLSEEDPKVHYNGSDVIKQVLETRKDFPVFILTSFEDDAIDKGFDVNIVYEKKDIQSDSNFFNRVITQIKKHKAKIESAEIRLLELIEKKKNEPLLQSEEKEFLDLDILIEGSLDKRAIIPDDLKINSNTERLESILKKADEIIKEVKNKEING